MCTPCSGLCLGNTSTIACASICSNSCGSSCSDGCNSKCSDICSGTVANIAREAIAFGAGVGSAVIVDMLTK